MNEWVERSGEVGMISTVMGLLKIGWRRKEMKVLCRSEIIPLEVRTSFVLCSNLNYHKAMVIPRLVSGTAILIRP